MLVIGLGVVVRIDEPLSDAARAALRPLGFTVGGGDTLVPEALPSVDDGATRGARVGPGTVDAPAALNRTAALPPLARWGTRIGAAGMTPLLRDDHGAALVVWHAAGQGRIGLWPLADTFRLVLAGRGDAYAELWSAALTTLGRGTGYAAVQLTAAARVGQRATLCGGTAETRVVAPDGGVAALRPDPAGGGCAAFWPRIAGWHRIVTGTLSQGVFAVAAADALPQATAWSDRAATMRLAAAVGSEIVKRADASSGPWPWFAAWLAVSSGLWWFERTRRGKAESRPPAA